MTAYLTATQAATRLGKSEKTIRRWIKEGRLVAHHPMGRPNLLAISESDIERLATELEPYMQPEPHRAASELGDQTQELEQRIAALESRVTELERLLSLSSGSVGTAAVAIEQPATRTYHKRATETPGPLERLPSDSIQHFEFAKRHGVITRTFTDQIKAEKVKAISHDISKRPGQQSHWLSPEQQRAAIVFWQANGTPFHECIIPACPCHALVSGHDQDTSELEQEKP